MGLDSSIKINFIHDHRLLGVMFYLSTNITFVSQFHPSSIHMMRMDDDSDCISPNGPKSHIICKDCTWTKHKIWVEKLSKLLAICLWTKKSEANLKGLPWGFKTATKKKKKLIPLLNLAAQEKNQKWAVPWDPNTILEKEGLNHQPVGRL